MSRNTGVVIRTRTLIVAVTVAVVGLCLARPAAAQEQASAPSPSTMTLDRMDASTRFGVQVGLDKIDRVALSDGFGMRFEPYGQYVLPNRVVGIYAQLPIAHDFDFNAADVTGIGNLDLGAYVMPTHGSDLILRFGFAVPTASTDFQKEITNILGTFERLTDLLLVAPKYTTIRLSASTVQESGRAFFRGDLGFDLVIDEPSSSGGNVYLRANVAGGVRLDSVDLAAELVNIGVLDGHVNGGIDNRFFHTFAVSLRTRGTNQFHVGTVFPLDEFLRGELWILSLGFQRVL